MRVSAFVTTIGSTTLPACLQRLREQTVECPVYLVENVAPFSAALQRMVDSCTTELVVQVDEDMLLEPFAIERLVGLIDKAPDNTVMSIAPLWDADLEMIIYGVKIYRHALVRQVPFESHVLGDRHDRELWEAAGFQWTRAPKVRGACIGEHGTDYTPEQIFERWRRLWQKKRAGKNIGWLEAWPDKLLERAITTRSRRDLFAFLGTVVGASEELWPDGDTPDFRRPNAVLDRLLELFP